MIIILLGSNQVPPWRNRLARSAVNRKVGGSSPPGGDYFKIRISRKSPVFE